MLGSYMAGIQEAISNCLLGIDYDADGFRSLRRECLNIIPESFELFQRRNECLKKIVRVLVEAGQQTEAAKVLKLHCKISLSSRLSSTKFSKMEISIILEQELTVYEEMFFQDPMLCAKMQIKITEVLSQHKYITPENLFQKAQILVRKGKALRFGDNGLTKCINCLSEAINIMEEMCKKETCTQVHINHQLGVAYGLRALCNQEALCKNAGRDSKQILEDVKAALNIWLSIYCGDCYEEGQFVPLCNNMILLYNIVDLIQLKGFMELSNDAYKLLIRMFELKSVSVEKWLMLLWESRRLSDTLCISPVNEAFTVNSKFKELSTIDFWISNLRGNQELLLCFQHNFSFLFANTHLNSSDRGSSFRTDITSVEVQEVARKLNETKECHSSFLAGNLLIDLSQRHIANGQLIEALSFAREANIVHGKLLSERCRMAASVIEVKQLVAMKVMLFDSISWDIESSYLSPWKLIECYLVSNLQVGLIYKMMGDCIQAELYFEEGLKLSLAFDFPLFTFTLYNHLGSMYVKKDWKFAKQRLDRAKMILDSRSKFCCSRCQIVLEVTLNESLEDLYKSKPNTSLGLEKLALSKPRNCLSLPEEGSDATATVANCAARKTCSCSTKNEAGEDIMRCWHCLSSKVMKSGLLGDFVNLKWEFVRRKLSMKLLTREVKYLKTCEQINEGQIDKVREMLLEKISLLLGCPAVPPIHIDLFRDLVAKVIPGDIFAIERAEIIYDICWYSLKFFHSKHTRIFCCDSSSIKFVDLASWLMVAFVVAHEVPLISQKVSMLLALMYVISASKEEFSLSSISKDLGEDFWSSFFHQNSIGTYFTSQFLSLLTLRSKGHCMEETPLTPLTPLRLVFEDTTKDPITYLSEYVMKFMSFLPSTSINCISLLEAKFTDFLQKLLNYQPRVQAWILISRLPRNSDPPFVLLFPLCFTLADHVHAIPTSFPMNSKPVERWHCPWSSSLVDHIAPSFRRILEVDWLVKRHQLFDTIENWNSCWELRKNLDEQLGILLRNLEDNLFGYWKSFLLGERCYKTVETTPKGLADFLRIDHKFNANDSILKVIFREEKAITSLEKDCYIAKVGYCSKNTSGLLFEVFKDEMVDHKVGDSNREPVILVLNDKLQTLPLENFPTLKNHEIYRMPSFSGINFVLDNANNCKGQVVGRNLVPPFPSIDPSNFFY